MKATEVLNRYAKGERDFRGINFQGQSFKGQDLSGADFSESDIRGTNFTNAILKQTNFTRALAGIQKRWWLAQQTLAFFFSALVGFLSTFSGAIIANLLFDTSSSRTTNFIAGVVISGMVVVVAVAVALQGFTTKLFSTIAVAVTIAVTIAVAVAVNAAFVVAFASAFGGAVACAVSVAVSVAVACAGTVVVAVALIVAFVVTVVSAGIVGGTFGGAFVCTIVSLLIGIYSSRGALKGDEKFAFLRIFGVAFGAIGGTSFCGADLTHANFSHATLKKTNFNSTRQKQTILKWVNWKNAKCLDLARVGNSILANPAVRELLVTRRGDCKSYVDANLRATILDGVNLAGADLTWADLSCASLRHATLTNANLSESLVLHTDFTKATLTGACLESWNIVSQTILDQVDCQYVYLLRNQQERRPSSGDFAPGEFTKLFQEVLNTVDLIFRNGVDWKAFVAAFKQVQVENEDTPLEIQSIENKGDGVVVVRVNVPPDTNKEKIHREFNQQYEQALKALEAKYRAELQARDGQIAIYREQNANMMEITKLLASRPINVEANAMSNSQSGDIYSGTIKATNFAPHGIASGGTFNDYSQTIINNLDEIGQLINTLRSQAEQFPQNARNEVLEHLNDLQEDLKHPEQVKPSRLKASLAAILAIAVGLGGAISTATDFSNNVLELGKKFGVELVQPQNSQVPSSQDIQTVDVKRIEGGE